MRRIKKDAQLSACLEAACPYVWLCFCVLPYPMLQHVWVQEGLITQELRHSAHSSAVHDVVFPHGCSDLIASCSYEEVRVWDTRSKKELLRIRLPGLECLCLAITQARNRILIRIMIVLSMMKLRFRVHAPLCMHFGWGVMLIASSSGWIKHLGWTL